MKRLRRAELPAKEAQRQREVAKRAPRYHYRTWSESRRTKFIAAAKARNKRLALALRAGRYGLTEAQLKDLYARQDGCCANLSCRMSEEQHQATYGVPLHIDHDHKTGVVRGLLCKSCNGLLGLAKDSPAVLIGAAKFLLQTKGDL